MKFIRFCLAGFLVLFVAGCGQKSMEIEVVYNFIKKVSEDIKKDTGLELALYGVNGEVPKEYVMKNEIYNIHVTYWLYKNKQDELSLEEVRRLTLSVAEKLVREFNSDPVISQKLEFHPFSFDDIELYIHIVDENKIALGQGVSTVYFSKGKVKYKGFEIIEYSNTYPARGRGYTIHEESYAEALDIVKKQGCNELDIFSPSNNNCHLLQSD